jgi:hypothetical protein
MKSPGQVRFLMIEVPLQGPSLGRVVGCLFEFENQDLLGLKQCHTTRLRVGLAKLWYEVVQGSSYLAACSVARLSG